MAAQDKSLIDQAKEKYPNISALVSVFSMSFEWVSDDFAGQLGYAPEKLKQMSLRDIAGSNSSNLFSTLANVAFSDGVLIERSVKRADGKEVGVSVKVSKFTVDNELFLAVTDVKFK